MGATKTIEVIDTLIKTGQEFTFKSYTDRKDSEVWGGDPNASWLTWTSRIKIVLDQTVNRNSSPFVYYNTANKIPLAGYESTNFDDAKFNYLKALTTVKSILENGDYFNELIDKSILVEAIKAPTKKEETNSNDKKKVFIVHGHDHNLKAELEVFLLKLQLDPIVLHREVDGGQTIIEKFEANSDVSFVFILLTPDEITYTTDQQERQDHERKKEFRARPNVIFEFGYFIGKLSRKKVCALHKGDVALPSDLSGVIYKKVDKSIEDIGFALIKELKAAGLSITI